MMSEFSIETDDRATQQLFGRLNKIAGDKSDVMRKVSLAMKQLVFDSFRLETDPYAKPWAPLSPLTLKGRRRRNIFGINILVATEKMYDSIKESSSNDGANVSVGEGLPDARAWYNQFGTLHNPTRPMLPIDNLGGAVNPTQEWLERMLEPINEAVREATA